MERKEPTARLVYALGDEVRGINRAVIEQFLVLKRIVNLGIRHGTRVEPNVDKVGFAVHRCAGGRNQHDVVDIRTVQVDEVVVFAAVIAGNESFLLERIGRHHTGGDSLLDFVIKFLDRADTDLFARLIVAPNRERCAPIARAAEVPVVEIFEPFAETSRTRRFGFPANRFVQRNHALFGRSGADEPAVKRVIEHRFVGAPAVRIVVHVLFDLESGALLLHFHADHDVEILGLGSGLFVIFAFDGEARIVSVLHIVAGVVCIAFGVHAVLHKGRSAILERVVTSRQVDHRTRFAASVEDKERGDAGGLGHFGVVSTESGRNVHDTRTIFGGYVVTGDDAERAVAHFHEAIATNVENAVGMRRGIVLYEVGDRVIERFAGLYPRHELGIAHAHEVAALERAHHAIGQHFVAGREGHFGFGSLGLEVGGEAAFGQDSGEFFTVIGVERLHGHVVDVRADAECGIRGEGPRRGCPSEEDSASPFAERCGRIEHFELGRDGRVLHIAVSAGLVEFVARETGTGSGAVRLNGVALVEITLVIQLTEQPPKCFDVGVFVRHIGVFHVHPVAHEVRKIRPFARELHDVAAALGVVLVDRDFLADIFLGDAEFFLHAKFNGETVGVPTGFAFHLKALHRFVTTEHVFDGARHHVVNAGVAVSRRGTFEKHIGGATLALCDAFVEEISCVPLFEDFFVDGVEVHPRALGELFYHRSVSRYVS